MKRDRAHSPRRQRRRILRQIRWRLRRDARFAVRRRRIARQAHELPDVRQVRAKFSGILDLVANPWHTRTQLTQLLGIDLSAQKHLIVFVDLLDVVWIDAASLTYLFALLDALTRREVSLRGNYPRSLLALKTLADANFEQFLRLPVRALNPDVPKIARVEPRLEMCTGNASLEHNPKQWEQLRAFMRRTGGLNEQQLDDVYNALSECIENVRFHAFPDEPGQWYAVAIRPHESMPARIVVLDLGQGIPSSLRTGGQRDMLESMTSVWKMTFAALRKAFREDLELAEIADVVKAYAESTDAALLWLACNGFRSGTRMEWRGKGLSSLRQRVGSGAAGLHVSSGDALVSYAPEQRPNLSGLPILPGTVVAFDLLPGDVTF